MRRPHRSLQRAPFQFPSLHTPGGTRHPGTPPGNTPCCHWCPLICTPLKGKGNYHQDTEAGKCLTCRRRHFQIYFLVGKLFNSSSNFTEICTVCLLCVLITTSFCSTYDSVFHRIHLHNLAPHHRFYLASHNHNHDIWRYPAHPQLQRWSSGWTCWPRKHSRRSSMGNGTPLKVYVEYIKLPTTRDRIDK